MLPKTIDEILNDLGLQTPTLPLSYTTVLGATNLGARVGLAPNSRTHPDVTVVILNWSRLQNVVHIASLLCGPWLDDTVAEVYVWNNSPQKLSKEIFSSARCDTRKLRIENSPENLYFYARFLACTKTSTPYCFIQDDDYVILPELIKTLRCRIQESSQSGIFLLPPHEHLSSQLRTTVTSKGIHTGFAWLGHGAMLHRQPILDFISLLHDDSLDITDEQIRMADNYFTILSNETPEIWFDQGVELGGGHPFTVGHEGNKRNRMHIKDACHLLDRIIARSFLVDAAGISRAGDLRFVKGDDCASDSRSYPLNRAAALGTPYLLETNIKLLPDAKFPDSLAATDMLENEERRFRAMGEDAVRHYQEHPLSCAVDGNVKTAFLSPYNVKQGDYILIDVLSAFDCNGFVVEMVFLVDPNNEEILHGSKYECSLDGNHWVLSSYQPMSRHTTVRSTQARGDNLLECSVRMAGDRQARFFKATAGADASLPWVVHEVWVRSLPQNVEDV